MSATTDPAGHVYRVDKFAVPAAAREEFIGRVRQTHELLRQQPGFVRDALLEQVSGPGRFNIVTMVEWSSAAAMEPVRALVAALHARSGFDPRELYARLGIEVDIAVYRAI